MKPCTTAIATAITATAICSTVGASSSEVPRSQQHHKSFSVSSLVANPTHHEHHRTSNINRVPWVPSSVSLADTNLISITTSIKPSSIRGGACSDTTPTLFAKVLASAAVETFLMHQLLMFGVKTKSTYSTAIRIAVCFSVIFGSAYFGILIDNGLSSATKQVLAPNEIPGDSDWYSNLAKPRWNPPGWLFPIMWLIISKPTQFVAVWKLMATSSEKRLALPFLVYCAHLSLGDAWNKVFFGLQCIGRGMAVIFTFWSVLWSSAYLFREVDSSAGLFLLPTCLWVTVAAALNWSIFLLNREKIE
eukprot:scaffold130_cov185-Alexandrium_tamarense.AAC.14